MPRRGRPLSSAMLLWAVATVAAGAFLLGTSEPVAACSCVSFTDEEALERADAVFAGTLVEIVTPGGDTYSSTDPERFVFDVDGVFKGEVFTRQVVVTARDGASCGLEIEGPGPFVVFATTESHGLTSGAADDELYSGLCSGTRVLTSDAIPASFGIATAPLPVTSATDETGDQRSIARTAAMVGALALVGAGGAFAVYRRKRSAT